MQELVALASVKEGATQAIQEMEEAKLRLAEQKMASLVWVEGAMQAQLRAAGGALDEHAGACCSYHSAASDAVLCRTGRCSQTPCRPGCELHVGACTWAQAEWPLSSPVWGMRLAGAGGQRPPGPAARCCMHPSQACRCSSPCAACGAMLHKPTRCGREDPAGSGAACMQVGCVAVRGLCVTL